MFIVYRSLSKTQPISSLRFAVRHNDHNVDVHMGPSIALANKNVRKPRSEETPTNVGRNSSHSGSDGWDW